MSADQSLGGTTGGIGGGAGRARGVWITRVSPGADTTARRVAALGLTPIVAPLLIFRSITADLDLHTADALAFTSINGVSRTAALTDRRAMRVFCVGDATADAARDAGFSDVRSAGGDVTALAALIGKDWPGRPVLHPAARQTAGDLVGMLNAAGVPARTVAVYETLVETAMPLALKDALDRRQVTAAVFHSPKAAGAAAAFLDATGGDLARTAAIGLSTACIDPLRAAGFAALISAPRPTEDALIETLARTCEARGHG